MNTIRTASRAFAAAAFCAAALLATPAAAGQAWYGTDGIAIDGADPVAYFTEGRPVDGAAAYSHDWMGLTWHFSSAANRDAFARSPERYAPQYGGYCAWAVAQGYTAKIDPAAWAIVDDRLYLNFSRGIQLRWSLDRRGNIRKADANWPGIREKLAAE